MQAVVVTYIELLSTSDTSAVLQNSEGRKLELCGVAVELAYGRFHLSVVEPEK